MISAQSSETAPGADDAKKADPEPIREIICAYCDVLITSGGELLDHLATQHLTETLTQLMGHVDLSVDGTGAKWLYDTVKCITNPKIAEPDFFGKLDTTIKCMHNSCIEASEILKRNRMHHLYSHHFEKNTFKCDSCDEPVVLSPDTTNDSHTCRSDYSGVKYSSTDEYRRRLKSIYQHCFFDTATHTDVGGTESEPDGDSSTLFDDSFDSETNGRRNSEPECVGTDSAEQPASSVAAESTQLMTGRKRKADDELNDDRKAVQTINGQGALDAGSRLNSYSEVADVRPTAPAPTSTYGHPSVSPPNKGEDDALTEDERQQMRWLLAEQQRRKPVECNLCQKTVTDRRRHIYACHLEQPPFRCPQIGCPFVSRRGANEVVNHLQSRHPRRRGAVPVQTFDETTVEDFIVGCFAPVQKSIGAPPVELKKPAQPKPDKAPKAKLFFKAPPMNKATTIKTLLHVRQQSKPQSHTTGSATAGQLVGAVAPHQDRPPKPATAVRPLVDAVAPRQETAPPPSSDAATARSLSHVTDQRRRTTPLVDEPDVTVDAAAQQLLAAIQQANRVDGTFARCNLCSGGRLVAHARLVQHVKRTHQQQGDTTVFSCSVSGCQFDPTFDRTAADKHIMYSHRKIQAEIIQQNLPVSILLKNCFGVREPTRTG